ncbi:hypothetical protein Vadar_002142 [Vaccinium darrowii]|uniref:Uncharacterized protein n=1 Tax=Vaccinium darrowii TaxID=229202 RepID=A0ACB7XMJ3_9ERIC|nr:hypothetical protein Vadar_002142 [Vaccinium darrowii]
MVELRCLLYIHVGGQIVRGEHVEYVKGVRAKNKGDPDSFSYYDLMEVIGGTGYGMKDNISLFYRKPMCDMNTGLVQLTCHDDMLHMFAEHSGNKYMVIDVHVHCPNVVDSDEEDEIDGDLVGDEVELGGDKDGDVVGDEVEVQPMDEDTDSDCEWIAYSDESSYCASFSGVEESFDEEQEQPIALVGLAHYNLGSKCHEEMDPCSDSDDNNLVEGSDDDGKLNFLEFKESFMKNPQLIEGMKFPNGFLAGCKPIIGLDACFFKSPFGGQLMHVVAKDVNNHMFPLAFVVVEAETKDSWT